MAAKNNTNKSKKAGNAKNRHPANASKRNDGDCYSGILGQDQLSELIRQRAVSPAVFSEFCQQLGIKQPQQQQHQPSYPNKAAAKPGIPNKYCPPATAQQRSPYKQQANQPPVRPVFSNVRPAFPQQRPFLRPPPLLTQQNSLRSPLMPTPTSENADVRGATTQVHTSSASKPDDYSYAAKLNPIDDVIRRINLPNQRVLILLRGCPGSGKTTLAKKLKYNGVILSADNYFMIDGQYVFDPLKLPDAHTSVKFQTLEHMQRGTSPIIIDNTNLESWEMEPYMLQAVKLRYFVALLEPRTPWRYDARVLAKMNGHNVPFGKISEMLQRFDHKVNVHVLRKLIQPKIDIYKQHKEYNIIKKAAESSVDAFVNANRLPSISEIMANNQQSKKPEDVPDSGLRKGSPLGRSMPSLLGDDSDVDEVGISKAIVGLSDSLLQPTKVESLWLGREKSAQDPGDLLSPNMKDLLDINFIECLKLEGKPQKSNDWKLPPFPDTPLSSTNDQMSRACSKIEAEKIGIHKTITPKALEWKSSPDSKEAISVMNLNGGSSTPKPKSAIEVGLEAVRREDAVRALKTHFSAVPIGDLEDLVVQCDGDVHWAANLLLDSGYKWMQKTEDGSDEAVEIESRAETDTDDDNSNDVDDVNGDSEMNGEIGMRDSSDEMDVSLADSPALIMRIDPIFAMQLEHLFGPVGFHVATGSYCGNDLNIELDLKTAQKVHTFWARSLAKKFEREEEILKDILKDETYAEQLQVVEDAHIAAKLDAQERDPNFPALTTEALLLEAKSKYPEATGDLASKIKRQQLYDLFPKIDRKAIDNVFDAHSGNMMETKQAIETTYSPHEVPRLVVAPEMITDYEKACLKIVQQENLLPMKEKEALQSVVDPSYEDLRAEATVHYHRRQECFTRAQEAYGKNMSAVASFYSQQGHLHTQKLHGANKRAKDIILTRSNAGQRDNTLDLHMLHVHEAMEALNDFLDQKKKEFRNSNASALILTLVTGKGTHSENGVPRIKPAVLDFLLRHDEYRVCDVNGGVIEVALTDRDQ